jgi:mannose-6-phosphate isomerase-like protein (cupin superfamily)
VLLTVRVPESGEQAPDGSTVFPLLRTEHASVGIIHLHPGQTTAAVRHQTIEEVWYVLEGTGEIWRQHGSDESLDALERGACVNIPAGASFQFRASRDSTLMLIMLTVPPWPGASEATFVDGPWASDST